MNALINDPIGEIKCNFTSCTTLNRNEVKKSQPNVESKRLPPPLSIEEHEVNEVKKHTHAIIGVFQKTLSIVWNIPFYR